MTTIMSCYRQGIGVALTVRALRDLIPQKNPQLVFLIETKAKGNKVNNLRRSLSFRHVFFVDSVGGSGGLTVMWSDDFHVEVMEYSENFVHMKIKSNAAGTVWFLTGVYGNPTRVSFEEKV
ncbi:reverse transcriptase [Senna tora]|uniref:Reverse transcriptase n=1 Tax=Senna tora TaxID=362788 RepID=A0A834XB31_9FABA|nr:reverse transcriptase [Senna tora]